VPFPTGTRCIKSRDHPYNLLLVEGLIHSESTIAKLRPLTMVRAFPLTYDQRYSTVYSALCAEKQCPSQIVILRLAAHSRTAAAHVGFNQWQFSRSVKEWLTWARVSSQSYNQPSLRAIAQILKTSSVPLNSALYSALEKRPRRLLVHQRLPLPALPQFRRYIHQSFLR
jgi:hypothetical protein